MPITPDTDRNFLRGLSDFWTSLFNDTATLKALYDGTQIAYGQLYLDMLQLVLGTSLKHMPLFSKRYFHLYGVTPSTLTFVEGASRADDSYVYQSEDRVQAVPSLMNKVIDPTAVLENLRDYDVADGQIRFRLNPFDVDGDGNSYPRFPVRIIQQVFPALFKDPARRATLSAGVKPGDVTRLRVLNGEPIISRVANANQDELLLSDTSTSYQKPLKGQTFRLSVLRTPFDSKQVGVVLPVSPRSTLDVTSKVVSVTEGTYDVTFSEPVGEVDQYLYLYDAANPGNGGLYVIFAVTGNVVSLARPFTFVQTSTSGLSAHLVDFGGNVGSSPATSLGHTNLTNGSVVLAARRKFAVHALNPVTGAPETWPAGGNVVENVDYAVDYEAGRLTYFTGWDPLQVPRVNYQWSLLVKDVSYPYYGDWSSSGTYSVGDSVKHAGLVYTCVRDTASSTFSTDDFAPWVEPFAFDQARSQPQLGLWGVDVLVDEDALYTNFGYLLSFKKPTSEQYRAFLRGVSQLFLLGPTLERFESAMNVMAGYPVVRDTGEVLVSYDDGILYSGSGSGTGGQLIDSADGRDGVVSSGSGGNFESASANFFTSDVGAIITTRHDGVETAYNITTVYSSHVVELSPFPTVALANVQWSLRHNFLTSRFRVTSGAVSFSPEDVNGVVWIEGSANARNNGLFKVVAVENATTLVLETPYGFTDESELTWKFSRVNRQTVVTSRDAYELPLDLPVRPELKDVANRGSLKFEAFDALTTAFRVVDYKVDPTWWHNIDIPGAILDLNTNDVTTRRRVSAQLIEHVVNPLDQAVVGDFGLSASMDDESRTGITRTGRAIWYGAQSVVLDFAAGTPLARPQDVGTYLVIKTAPYAAQYKITRTEEDLATLTLDNFPPREAMDLVPPQVLDVELPPLLYRRSVAFVMFDRFLKYHAIQIKIDKAVSLSADFIEEITALIKQAKPSYTFIYVEPVTNFTDKIEISDHLELAFGPYLTERLYAVETMLRADDPGELKVNDFFVFRTAHQPLTSPDPGTTTLSPAAPYDVPYRKFFVSGRFSVDTTVSGAAGRRPVEGLDYTFNYTTGLVTLLTSLDGSTEFYTVVVFLRTRETTDTLVAFETAICATGSDPTVRRNPLQTGDDSGLMDRALQLNIT